MHYKKSKYSKDRDFPIVTISILVLAFFGLIKLFYASQIFFWITLVCIIVVSFFILFIIKRQQSKKYKKIRRLGEMKNMHWREFEKFIAFVLKKNGFTAKERIGTNDGGIDVDAKKDGIKYVVQCKKWNEHKISAEVIQAFVGAMKGEGDTTKGIFITTSRFTKPAREYAKKIRDLELWDADNLEKHILEFTQSKDIIEKRNPLCELCGAEMVVKKSYRGKNKGKLFYGCSTYPKCKATIDIKSDS